MILIISAVSKFLLEIHLFLCFKHSLKLQVSNVFSKKKMVLRPSPSLRKSRCLTIADRAIAIFEIIAKSTSLHIGISGQEVKHDVEHKPNQLGVP